MAIDEELLRILVCPETKQPVKLAPANIVQSINERISRGEQKNRKGFAVKEKIDAGLLRADSRILYPIRDDIPVMLVEEALELA